MAKGDSEPASLRGRLFDDLAKAQTTYLATRTRLTRAALRELGLPGRAVETDRDLFLAVLFGMDPHSPQNEPEQRKVKTLDDLTRRFTRSDDITPIALVKNTPIGKTIEAAGTLTAEKGTANLRYSIEQVGEGRFPRFVGRVAIPVNNYHSWETGELLREGPEDQAEFPLVEVNIHTDGLSEARERGEDYVVGLGEMHKVNTMDGAYPQVEADFLRRIGVFAENVYGPGILNL